MNPSVFKKADHTPSKKLPPSASRRYIEQLVDARAPDLADALKELVVDHVARDWKDNKYPRAALEKIIEESVTMQLEEMGYLKPTPAHAEIKPPAADDLSESLLQWLGNLDGRKAKSTDDTPSPPPLSFMAPPATAVARLFKLASLDKAPGDLCEIFDRVARAAADHESAYSPMHAGSSLKNSFLSLMSEGRFVPEMPLMRKILAHGSVALDCALLKTTGPVDSRLECIKWATLFDQDNYDITLDLSDMAPPEGETEVFTGFINLLHQSLQTHKAAYSRPKKRIVIPLDHPEIQSVIEYVGNPSHFFSFTFVATQNFIHALLSDGEYLTSTRTSSVKARDMAWRLASLADKDIDILFSDHFPAGFQSLPGAIPTASGLQLLYPDHSLLSGFINLTAFIQERDLDWAELASSLKIAVHLMDNLPVSGPAKPRQISIGVTGWAELLESFKMGYASQEASLLSKRLARFLFEETTAASKDLGLKRGSLLPSGKRHLTVCGLGNTENVSILFGQKGGLSPLTPQSPETVLKTQAAFQEQSDNIVSVPVRLDRTRTSPREVLKLILLANKLRLPLLSIRRA
jgi:hypothetical protein